MIICKELPGTPPSSTHNRTLFATGCLSLFLHALVVAPLWFVLSEKNIISLHDIPKDIPMEISIATEVPTPPVIPTDDIPPTPPLPSTPSPLQAAEPEVKPLLKPVPAPATTAAPSKKTIKNHSAQPPVTPHKPAAPTARPTSPSAPPIARYEQIISLWYKNHQLYDDHMLGSRDALLRIRLNQSGALIFCRLDKATGDARLDQYIINSAKNASPFPPIPTYYSANQQEEFLIPINTPNYGNTIP